MLKKILISLIATGFVLSATTAISGILSFPVSNTSAGNVTFGAECGIGPWPVPPAVNIPTLGCETQWLGATPPVVKKGIPLGANRLFIRTTVERVATGFYYVAFQEVGASALCPYCNIPFVGFTTPILVMSRLCGGNAFVATVTIRAQYRDPKNGLITPVGFPTTRTGSGTIGPYVGSCTPGYYPDGTPKITYGEGWWVEENVL